MNNTPSTLKQQRIQRMQDIASHELDRLVTSCAEFHNNIKTAKTATKRSYYQRKFDKAQKDLLDVVSTRPLIDEYIKKENDSTSD